MATSHLGIRALLRRVGATLDERPDEQLLADYFAGQDEGAFATLVGRHQDTVWAVCSRFLTAPADREDAFQATFLVLARSGRLLTNRGGIGGWLYRVAERVARKARIAGIRRRRRERRAALPEATTDRHREDDLLAVVAAELDRLTERDRLAILACDFDGLERAEAARRLGCGEGTLSARLHRGRKRLAELLRARGITVPAAGWGAVLAAPGAVSADAGARVAHWTALIAENGFRHPAVPTSVTALVRHTTREMAMRILKCALATVTALAVATTGWFVMPGGTGPHATAAPVPERKVNGPVKVPDSALQLLRNRKIHRELKLTSDQRVIIADHFDDQFEATANAGPLPGNPGTPEEVMARLKERQAEAVKATKEMAEKTLTAAQLKRLAEVELQVRGAEAFARPEVEAALKLTNEQKKATREAIDTALQPGPVAPPGIIEVGPNTGPAARQAKPFWTLDPKERAVLFAKVQAVLTKEQTDSWKRLTGEPVGTFDPHAIGGRGGSTNSGIQFRGDR